MLENIEFDIVELFDRRTPPLGIVFLTIVLGIVGLSLLLTMFSVVGGVLESATDGTMVETGVAGAVLCALALVTAAFYATLYGLWTMTDWGWYGTLVILSCVLLLELARLIGYALQVDPVMFLLEPHVDRLRVTGVLVSMAYLYRQRVHYLNRRRHTSGRAIGE